MLATLIASAALFGSRPALAHPDHGGLPSSRYVVLEVERGHLRLAYSLIVQGQSAEALRRRADGDRNGEVSPAEMQALAIQLGREVSSALQVTVGPGPVHRPQLAPRGPRASVEPVGPAPLAVDLEWRLPLAAGKQRLRFIDEFTPSEPAPAELAVKTAAGVRASAVVGSAEEGPLKRVRPRQDPDGLYHYGARTGQRRRAVRETAMILELDAELPPPPPRPLAPALAAAAGLTLLGGLGWWFWRRRRIDRE